MTNKTRVRLIAIALLLWWGSAIVYGIYTVVVYGDEMLEKIHGYQENNTGAINQ